MTPLRIIFAGSGEFGFLFAALRIECTYIVHRAKLVMHRVVAGLQLVPALLVQQYYRRLTEREPSVDEVERYLRSGAATIIDDDPNASDPEDNVPNTSANQNSCEAKVSEAKGGKPGACSGAAWPTSA